MGSRGPLPRRAKSATTAEGVRLRRLPTEPDAIFRRLARDIEGLTPADVPLLELTAMWVAIGKKSYADMIDQGLTVTDTAHGNGEESRKNALVIVLRAASQEVRLNVQQLGASPLARARMPAVEHEQLSLADVLFGDAATHPAEPAFRDE